MTLSASVYYDFIRANTTGRRTNRARGSLLVGLANERRTGANQAHKWLISRSQRALDRNYGRLSAALELGLDFLFHTLPPFPITPRL